MTDSPRQRNIYIDVNTPLNISLLESELADHPDRNFVEF